ncbi:6-phosphofructokinase [Oceanivirga salmonicida]|uniref:6-phosphofructokinase n=1 Tax=Oceanivirga salmonicida TaxID=1769291 RepID=UPI0008358228|nr:6-phosphofructokinase [Oceanivirga salmonicida]
MKKIAILTSGGDSQGMNTAIRTVAKAAMSKGWEVYGVKRGYKGLVDNDMKLLTPLDIAGLTNKGGTKLLSARLPEFKNPEVRAIAAENLRKRGIDSLVVIGGDGSYHGAHYLYEEQGIKTVGIPGTIDNDIAGTDYTIGYDTALNIVIDFISKIQDTAKSHERTVLVEVMGRNCGDIALYGGIAAAANGILIPEVEWKIEDLENIIKERRKKGKNYDVIVVSEGVGNTEDIAKELSKRMPELDVKTVVLGHVQRGGSPTASDRLIATKLGIAAVDILEKDEVAGVMVGLQKTDIVINKLSYAWENYSKKNQEYYDIAMMLSI